MLFLSKRVSGPIPLRQEVGNRLSAEFVTLCRNGDDVTKKLKAKAQNPYKIRHKDIWYKILTDKAIYRHSKHVNGFAQTFLNRRTGTLILANNISVPTDSIVVAISDHGHQRDRIPDYRRLTSPATEIGNQLYFAYPSRTR